MSLTTVLFPLTLFRQSCLHPAHHHPVYTLLVVRPLPVRNPALPGQAQVTDPQYDEILDSRLVRKKIANELPDKCKFACLTMRGFL